MGIVRDVSGRNKPTGEQKGADDKLLEHQHHPQRLSPTLIARKVSTASGNRISTSISPTAASEGGVAPLSYFWNARLPPPMIRPAYLLGGLAPLPPVGGFALVVAVVGT